jgi:hypothetical protein
MTDFRIPLPNDRFLLVREKGISIYDNDANPETDSKVRDLDEYEEMHVRAAWQARGAQQEPVESPAHYQERCRLQAEINRLTEELDGLKTDAPVTYPDYWGKSVASTNCLVAIDNSKRDFLLREGGAFEFEANSYSIPLYTSPPSQQEPVGRRTERKIMSRIPGLEVEIIRLRDDLTDYADKNTRLEKENAALKADAERWKYWKPRMIAADFEWGQFKEPVLVFSLNCKVSADLDKSTDEAIAATGSNHVDK